MIKCGVCGSENEAAALFCGTCGSPLSPADAKSIAEEADKTTIVETSAPDGEVVPGKGGGRRELGTGGETGTGPIGTGVPPGGRTEKVVPEPEPEAGAATIVCSVCGTVNEATRTYCRKCANELKPVAKAPPPVTAGPTGRRIPPIALGLGAAGLVLAVGVIAILAFNNSPTPPGATATLAAQVSQSPVVAGTPAPSEGTVPPSSPSPFDEGEPEGRIVFARCEGNTNCVIFEINADGTEVGPLTAVADVGSASDPALSNDGNRVIFTVRDGLRILDIDSGDVIEHSATRGDTNGFWSPDDTQVTFSGRRDPPRDEPPTDDREIRFDGVTVTGPSEPLTANGVEDHDPVFTRDGRSIIWVQGEGDERELKMIRIRSGKITDLTSDSFNDVDPVVSPDGTQIVFASTRGSGEFDLFLMDLATLEITPLPTMDGDEHDPTWSPGGRYIVFSGGDSESNDLFILDLADGLIDPLTSTGERDLAPSWQP